MLAKDFPVTQWSSSLLVIFFSCLLFSCGKVVQIEEKEEQITSFSATYTIPLTESSDGPTVSQFSHSDSPVYASVAAVKPDGGLTELSWGRGVLLSSRVLVDVSPNVEEAIGAPKRELKTVFRSQSFRKDGVKLTGASDLSWTKLEYKRDSLSWAIDSKKLELGFPYYFVRVYTDSQRFLMKVLDHETVSMNVTQSLGDVTPYDTFLAILMLQSLQQGSELLDEPDRYAALTQLFTVDVFQMLGAITYKNRAKNFLPTHAEFIFSGGIVGDLLVIFELAWADSDEAKRYVKALKAPWLNKALRAALLERIDTFVLL